jgi:hypothetical protein
MMELKDLANYGSFGAAIPGTRSLKKDEEEEKRRMAEEAAAMAAAQMDATQGPIKRGLTAGLGMKKGGKVKKMAKGGSVGSASKRADGCAKRGKTRGKMV